MLILPNAKIIFLQYLHAELVRASFDFRIWTLKHRHYSSSASGCAEVRIQTVNGTDTEKQSLTEAGSEGRTPSGFTWTWNLKDELNECSRNRPRVAESRLTVAGREALGAGQKRWRGWEVWTGRYKSVSGCKVRHGEHRPGRRQARWSAVCRVIIPRV